ncbi:MAG: hypothetical protein M5U11_00710 [Anaerolineales bacterium]|nr:hypothetical protein [Anaerolineales bacterium]
MTKPSFPKHLKLKEMEPTNKGWFELFKGKTNYKPGYYQTIENFLKYSNYKDKPFNTFTLADVEDYIFVMWDNNYSSKRTDGVVATISSFKNFLIKNSSFPPNFLDKVLSLQVNESSVSDSEPLSLFQLHNIREYNNGSIVDEFIFEMYFQLGIDKQDLAICIPQNADNEKRCFRFKGKEIRYNQKIEKLISKIQSVDGLATKIKSIDYRYLKNVTTHLKSIDGAWQKERALNYSDILKSHQVYMIKCPNVNCGELSENIQQNWVLVKQDFDTEYRLFCSQCKGTPYER